MITRFVSRIQLHAKGALIASLALFSVAALAARIELLDAKNMFCDKLAQESACLALRLTGELKPGDNDRLIEFIARLERTIDQKPYSRVGTVFLNSPGGEMQEALKIGRTIRNHKIVTVVAQPSQCASACVIILAGGVMRFPVGIVEVHSFYSPDLLGTREYGKAEEQYKQMQLQVSEYLREMRIPAALLDEMMRIPYNRSRALGLAELERLSLIGIDPVYAQVRPAPPGRSW